ncbi:MAG: hypothetical protein R3F56_16920 [Planctomycetota bacterium]
MTLILRLLLPFALPVVLLAAGCAIDPIRANDHGELFAHGRVEAELGPGRHDPGVRPFRHSVEVGLTGVDGRTATNDFEVGIERYRMVEASAAWKPTWQVGPSVSLSGLVGLAYEDFSFDFDSSLAAGGPQPLGANGPTYDDRALAGMLGVEVRAGLPAAGVYGRTTQASSGRATSGIIEVGVELRPHPSFAVQVAYRWWKLEALDISGAPAALDDVDLRVDGLTVGGVLRF